MVDDDDVTAGGYHSAKVTKNDKIIGVVILLSIAALVAIALIM